MALRQESGRHIHTVCPIEKRPGKEVVATVYREDDAGLIASTPELYQALYYATKSLRATEAFMTDKGLMMGLSEFGGFITDYDGMTPEDVRAMRAVHRKFYECSVLARERLKEAEDIDRFLRKNVQL